MMKTKHRFLFAILAALGALQLSAAAFANLGSTGVPACHTSNPSILPQAAQFESTKSAIAFGWMRPNWLCSVHGFEGRGVTQMGAIFKARELCRNGGGDDNGVVPWCEQNEDWCREI